MLKNGDYVPDGKGGFLRAEGADEILQRALFLLTVRRGSFPFLPDLGSRLYLLTREKPSRWQSLAGQYAAEALGGELDLEVTGVTVTPLATGARVQVALNWRGEDLSLSLEVNG